MVMCVIAGTRGFAVTAAAAAAATAAAANEEARGARKRLPRSCVRKGIEILSPLGVDDPRIIIGFGLPRLVLLMLSDCCFSVLLLTPPTVLLLTALLVSLLLLLLSLLFIQAIK